MNNITKVLKRLGLKKKDYDLFGEAKAKIKLDFKDCINDNGKLMANRKIVWKVKNSID